jgi:hypothetical protein
MNLMNEVDDNLAADPQDDDEFRPELPPPDFDFLVYSLRLQAELNMGLLPFAEKPRPDFDLGRHNIDLLAMLQQKTKGNLTIEEQRSLDNSVTELRFRFVHAREEFAKDESAKKVKDELAKKAEGELAKKVEDEQAKHADSTPRANQQTA